MQAPVEIHYAGVVVGRAEDMREVEGGELFIAMKEPMPVGTLVGVSTPEAQLNVRVAHVVETVDGADNGMRVRRLRDGDPDANLWVPPPPAKPAPVPERAAAPVAEEKEPVETPATTAPEPQAAPPESAPVEVQAPAATAVPEPVPAPESAPREGVADSGATASAETATERKAEQMPLIDDVPRARPTQGGNVRRRTKRRK